MAEKNLIVSSKGSEQFNWANGKPNALRVKIKKFSPKVINYNSWKIV